MARHMDDLTEIRAITAEVPSGSQLLPPDFSAEQVEKRKTKLLELTVHASDISFLARQQDV